MRRNRHLLGFIILLLAGCSHSKKPDPFAWKNISPPGAGFTVSMPGEPKLKLVPRPGPAGELVEMRYVYKGPLVLYQVSYVDYPTNVQTSATVDQLLDSACQGMGQQGRVEDIQKIMIGPYPGRSASLESSDITFRVRICLAGRRLYIAMAGAENFAKSAGGIDKFLNSFQFVGEAPSAR